MKRSVIAPLFLVIAGLAWLVMGGGAPQDEETRIHQMESPAGTAPVDRDPMDLESGNGAREAAARDIRRSATVGAGEADPPADGIADHGFLGVRIVGRLVDDGGLVHADLDVAAVLKEEDRDSHPGPGASFAWMTFKDRPYAEAVSQADGHFLLEVSPDAYRENVAGYGMRGGRLTYTVSGSGWSTQRQTVDGLVSGETHNVGDIRVSRAALVEGQILDTGGAPVPGARVVRRDAMERDVFGNNGVEVAVADDQGRFTVDNLEPGRFTLVARDMQHLPGMPLEFEVLPGKSLLDMTLILDPGASVSGRLLDARGSAAAGIMVWAWPLHDTNQDKTNPEWEVDTAAERGVASGPEGRFQIGGLVSNMEYQLVVHWETLLKDGGWVDPVHLGVTAPASGLALRQSQPSSIVGLIVVGSGSPVPGGTVEVDGTATHEMPRSSFTANWRGKVDVGNDGRFTLSGLQPGRHEMLIRLEGHPGIRVEGIEIPAQGGERNLGEIVVPSGGSLDVRVVDTVGAKLEGASVEMYPANSGAADARARRGFGWWDGEKWKDGGKWLQAVHASTDREGMARMKGLSTGAWLVFAEKDGYASAKPLTTTVRPGGIAARVEIVLEARGRIEGALITEGGMSGAGLHVQGRRVEENPTAEQVADVRPGDVIYAGGRPSTTAVNGEAKWTLDDLVAGTWHLWILPEVPDGLEYWDREVFLARAATGPPDAAVDLSWGGVVYVELAAPRWADLAGVVRRGGVAVVGAEVSALPVDAPRRTAGFPPSEFTVKTDGSGHYRMRGLRPGTWRIWTRGPNFGLPTTIEQVLKVGSNRLDLFLAGGSMAGQVTSLADGRGLAGAEVTVSFLGQPERTKTPAWERGSSSVLTGPLGYYLVEELPSGEFTVHVKAKHFVDGRRSVGLAMEAAATGVDFTLSGGGRLLVRVTGDPIPDSDTGVKIRRVGSGTSWDYKDGFGELLFTGLLPGQYEVVPFGILPIRKAVMVSVGEGLTDTLDL